MRAMVLDRTVRLDEVPEPLRLAELPDPEPAEGEVLVEVSTCGVCHTELDEIEGRTPPPRLPVVPGHQIVGQIVARGPGARRHGIGARVAIGWIHSSTGAEDENLSPAFRATGRDADGGYAELVTVPERYAYPVPDAFDDVHAAPLLCAGAIGYRSLRLAGVTDGGRLGLTGFGASAHLVLQLVRGVQPRTEVFVFARDPGQRAFARELGAVWAGATADAAPEPLDAIIDTTPAWTPVVEALDDLRPGGRLVINAIRKEDADKDALLRLRYDEHLWLERQIRSVANVTARDIEELLELAARGPLRPEVTTYPLEESNRALRELARGAGRGAKVLVLR